MKALYRRYRPKALAEVVGQEQITSVLQKSIETGKISHAYLFVGPRGTGKTSVARILAHEINHFKYELEDDYLDIIEIDAASNTGVDNIRDLRERAIIAPTKGKYKVYIIDEVHMLSKSAFNALLKTLEEPPEHVVFIMATTDAYKVPITITSRSQVFTFKLADPSTMFEHLKSICKSENINIEDDALKIVVRRGGGSFRDSLSLLDQISTLSDNKITADLITKNLGLPRNEAIEQLLAEYQSGDFDAIRKVLTSLIDSGVDTKTIAGELIDMITKNPEPVYLPLLDRLIDVNRSANPTAKLIIALCSTGAPAPVMTPVRPPIMKATTVTKTVTKPVAPAQKPITEPTPTPEAPVEEAPVEQTTVETKVVTVAPDAKAEEIWQAVLENVAAKASIDTTSFKKVNYTLDNNVLKIYAAEKFAFTRVEKRRDVIAEVLPSSIEIEIINEALVADPEVANIAALMGGGEEIEINE